MIISNTLPKIVFADGRLWPQNSSPRQQCNGRHNVEVGEGTGKGLQPRLQEI
jgi:hypothetical protein